MDVIVRVVTESLAQGSKELQTTLEGLVTQPGPRLEVVKFRCIECSIEEAWTFYSQMAEFVPVAFSQFKERVKGHRKQCRAQITRSDLELEVLAHDRQLFPRQMVNHRGEPVFDLLAAQLLLRADVKEGKHLRMTPSQLQLSQAAYAPFDPRKFKHRNDQEVRREKFLNYLAKKRAGILK